MQTTGFALALLALFATASSSAAELPRTAAPEGARLYFISPADGETVGRELVVRFGLSGMGVAPAGSLIANTGHHHLIINADLPPLGMPIPADEQHVHFGGGQTETTVRLEPGTHTLQLMLGDHSHIPHEPPVISERITIHVE